MKIGWLGEPEGKLERAAIVVIVFPLVAATVFFFVVFPIFMLITKNQQSAVDNMNPVLLRGLLLLGGLVGTAAAFNACKKLWPLCPSTLRIEGDPGFDKDRRHGSVELMERSELIEAARKFLSRDPAIEQRAAAFARVSVRDAVIVCLENEAEKTRYEVVLDAETGEFIHSSYRSPRTDG